MKVGALRMSSLAVAALCFRNSTETHSAVPSSAATWRITARG